MDTPSPTRDLRVCGTCWAVVHRDDVDRHGGWHDEVREAAFSEAWSRLTPQVAAG